MNGDDFRRNLRRIAAENRAPGLLAQVATATVATLPVDGVGLTLRIAPGYLQLMAATSATATRVEELQMTLGQGPTREAYDSYGPVFVEDLTTLEHGRWPVLESALTAADTGGLFAIPLELGAIRLGVLSLYRCAPGLLTDADVSRALEVGAAVTTALLMAGRGSSVDESVLGRLAGSEHSNQINQATGMVIAQLNVSAEEAYVRLRSHAFAIGRPLGELAGEVIHRQTRLDK